ncbi:MAG: aminopeptidase, partial [Prosthecobacter sp.]|nr:aminopeptidase [Prosthecobacter sp.]
GLSELLFHELTHQRLYLSGDTDFNEALATAVGREGARRWLRASGRSAMLATYEKELRVEKEFIAIALQSREELRDVYARTYRSSDNERAAKAAALDRLRRRLNALDRRYGGSLKIEKWFEKPVNNARLNTLATYYELVPGFEALLKKHHGDLELFFAEVKSMRALTKEHRAERLHALARTATVD